ncbi:MAG TPA: D-alanyl-D-alanine carboxypeptidase family protein [Bauldia sp.]|nr:D-alanyl-D-alanine carboxypeptidase family protein [Bauldia sp.]
MLLLLIAAIAAFAAAPAFADDAGPATILIDVDTGKVLSSNRSDVPWYPASVTKMMTAYVAFQALKAGQLKPTSPVKVSAHALAQAPSKMGFKVGTVMNVDNALKMMLVKSANDIAVAVAETVGGSEPKFAARMNAAAAALGMASTHYDNANGLPDGGQITTARDLAVLARALLTEFPQYRDYFGIPAIKAGKRILRSQNVLLERYRGTIGMKTGFICASGYNIVAAAKRGGRTLVAVVLGAASSDERNETAARLLDEGFANWFVGTKPDLASFQANRSLGDPVNLHDLICGKHPQQDASEEEASDSTAAGDAPTVKSALGPRFVLMDPVLVFTGRADPDPNAKPKPMVAANVPLPHLRPRAGDAAAYAPADAAAKSPTAIQAKP